MDRNRLAAEKQAASHALKQLKKQMRRAGVQRVDVAMPTPNSPTPLQALSKPQPVTNVRQPYKRKVPLIGVPLDVDVSLRAKFFEENIAFLNAANREAKLIAVSRMWATAMEAMGITSPFLEAPGAAVAQLEIMDLLSGRSSQLYQLIPRKDGKKAPRHTGCEWAAIMGILLCAAIVQKQEDVGLEKALNQAIPDLEKDLGCMIDLCLSGGEENDESKDSETNARDVPGLWPDCSRTVPNSVRRTPPLGAEKSERSIGKTSK